MANGEGPAFQGCYEDFWGKLSIFYNLYDLKTNIYILFIYFYSSKIENCVISPGSLHVHHGVVFASKAGHC